MDVVERLFQDLERSMKRPLTDTSTTKDAAGMAVDIYMWNLSQRTHGTSEKLSLALKKNHQRLTEALLMAKPGSWCCVCTVSQSVVKRVYTYICKCSLTHDLCTKSD